MVVDPQAKPAKILGETRAARRERDLRQEPEGVEKGRVTGGALKAGLGGISRRSSNVLDVGTEPEKADDLPPFLGLRKRAEANVTHRLAYAAIISASAGRWSAPQRG